MFTKGDRVEATEELRRSFNFYKTEGYYGVVASNYQGSGHDLIRVKRDGIADIETWNIRFWRKSSSGGVTRTTERAERF